MQFYVFICHASEDKNDFVRPLAEMLKNQHIDVWYDEFSLSVGIVSAKKLTRASPNPDLESLY